MKCGVIIVGAGQGTRLGYDSPKAFIPLGSKPLFQHSLDTFLAHSSFQEIVLVLPEKKCDLPKKDRIKIVSGGSTRQDSVQAGLKALRVDCDTVFVHDAARPFVTKEILDRLLSAVSENKNCIAAIPVTDTVKQTKAQKIIQTVDRSQLWLAQTPQAFSRPVLEEAFSKAQKEGWEGTDEASLVEKLGIPVHIVPGDARNIKITTPQDLQLAQVLLHTTKL